MLPLGQRLHLKSCLLARVRFPSSCSLESRTLHSLAPLEVFCPYPLSLTVQRICPSVTLSNGAPVPLSKLQTHTPPPPQSSTLPFSSSPPPGIRMMRRKTYLFFSLLYFIAHIWHLSQTSSPWRCAVENWLTLSLWLQVNHALASFSILTVPFQLPNGQKSS